MNTVMKVLPLLAASLGLFHTAAVPAAPVAINDYLGNWTSKAAPYPYAAGNVVTYSSKTWLSLVDGNYAKPGGVGAATKWRLLGDAKTFIYKVGDKGPGGGWIFYVDREDEYPGFTYLEAAPEDAGDAIWCDKDVSIPGANGEAAYALGRGKANTLAILAVCASGAAHAASAYRGPNNKSDWYLPSIGELKILYTKLLIEKGKGGFGFDPLVQWSSSEYDSTMAWGHSFGIGTQDISPKTSYSLGVRPVRAF